MSTHRPNRREYFREHQRRKRGAECSSHLVQYDEGVAKTLANRATAAYDPKRDKPLVYENAAAEFLGDPPIGRRAIDHAYSAWTRVVRT